MSKYGQHPARDDDTAFITGNVVPNVYGGNGLDFTRRQPFPGPAGSISNGLLPDRGNSLADDSKLTAPRPQSAMDDHRRNSLASSLGGRYHHEVALAKESLLGPKRPRPHKIWKKKFIKLLVVGDSGLGKTTLIKTLLSTPGERLNVHDGTSTAAEQFRKDPEALCSTIHWKDEEDRVIWVYRIQDTPGFGDDLNIMNNIGCMMEYIQKQNMDWLEMEMAKDRKEDLAEIEDPRVDVCIYCLPPHRLRPVDLRFMWELGQAVPVLPVVTKSDTMTIREAQVYRQEVYQKLMNPQLPGLRGKINVFQFEAETLMRAGITDTSGASALPPFLVIASNEINEDLNQQEPPVFWPERRYPWGTAEAFNPEHSDLLHLRALLLKEALEEISKTKRARYEGWRRTALGGWRVGRKVRRLIMWTVIPLVLGLHAGKSGFTVKDIPEVPGRVNRFVRKLLRLEPEKGKPAAAAAAAAAPADKKDDKRGRR